MGQEVEERKPFSVELDGRIGVGILAPQNNIRTTGNANNVELRFNLEPLEYLRFGIGVGFTNFLANSYLGVSPQYLQQTYLLIPLSISNKLNLYTFDDKTAISLVSEIGIYGNTLLKERIETYNSSRTNSKSGWSYGFQFRIGSELKVYNQISAGFGIVSQIDRGWMDINGTKSKLSTQMFYISFGIPF